MAREKAYPNSPVVMVFRTSNRSNAKVKMKIWKNKNIDQVQEEDLVGVPKNAEILELGIGEGFIKKYKIPQKIVAFLGWAIIANYLILSLVFFRATSVTHALVYIKNIFQWGSFHVNILNNYVELILCMVLIALVQTVHYFKGNK